MKPCKVSWRAKTKDGYPAMNKITYGYSLEHRYVYAAHHRIALTDKDIVRHTCDNPGCIEISHLVLGSVKDNVLDSVSRKRHKNPSYKGETNPNSYLSEEAVKDMLEMFLEGHSHSEIAKEFGVNRVTVLNIVNGKTWTHIERNTGAR